VGSSLLARILAQCPGATAVAVRLAGRSPERLMRCGERPHSSGLHECSRTGQRAGLMDQHLEATLPNSATVFGLWEVTPGGGRTLLV